MPKINQNKIKKERVIYLLLSPNDNKFMVGHCLPEAINETYRHNLKGRRDASTEFLKSIEPERPCLFILEKTECTVYEATELLIVWIKLFLNKGYECYNRFSLIEMTNDLSLNAELLFNKRVKNNLVNLTTCSKCIIPTYKKNTCSKYLTVTEKENRNEDSK